MDVDVDWASVFVYISVFLKIITGGAEGTHFRPLTKFPVPSAN